jgi:hypothetical protein
MFAENANYLPQRPSVDFSSDIFARYLMGVFMKCTKDFISYYHQHLADKSPNENKLRQHFVIKFSSELAFNLQVVPEYEDSFLGNTGRADFVIVSSEKGSKEEPLFWVEAKRLANLGKRRKKEYVIGNEHKDKDREQNGGIERFKLEKHGKGLSQSGMLGFVEQETFEYWHENVNEWICELANNDEKWDVREQLNLSEKQQDFAYYHSEALRTPSPSIKLHHFWINLT